MFLQRFGGGDRANIESQLTHIQQKTFVEDYLVEFTRLSCQVTAWTKNQLKHVFLGDLKEDIHHDVLALELESLHQAQKLARIFETKLQAKRFVRSTFSRQFPPLPPILIPLLPLQHQQQPQGTHPCLTDPLSA